VEVLGRKKSGKGDLSLCPYCKEKLEFDEQECYEGEIIERVVCSSCGRRGRRRFFIRFVSEDWEES